MAAKELDERTRLAERAEMQIRLQALPARRFAAAGSERPGTVLPRQAAARNAGPPPPRSGTRPRE